MLPQKILEIMHSEIEFRSNSSQNIFKTLNKRYLNYCYRLASAGIVARSRQKRWSTLKLEVHNVIPGQNYISICI